MQSLHSVNQLSHTLFYDVLTKLDRILRLYRCAKKGNSQMLEEVRVRTQNLMESLSSINPAKFKEIESMLRKIIDQSLAEVKVQSKQSNKSVRGGPQSSTPSVNTFGQSYQQKNIETSSIKKQSQQESSKNFSSFSSTNSMGLGNGISQKKIKSEEPNLFRFGKKQSSKQVSISSSSGKVTKDLRYYCQTHMNILETKIEINDDVVTHMNNQDPSKVYLLGVQKPQDMENQKLFICTMMEFTMEEATALKYKDQVYQTQLEEFENVIRCPFALCIIGESINDLRIHYVKFLLEMTSPAPVIIIFNQKNNEQSILVKVKSKSIDALSKARISEIEKMDQNFSKDKNLYKTILFSQIPRNKQRCVTTKILTRKYKKKVFENKSAIMIQNPKNNTQNLTSEKPASSSPTQLIGGLGGIRGTKVTSMGSFGQAQKIEKKQQPSIKKQKIQTPKQQPIILKKIEQQKASPINSSTSTVPKAFNYKLHAKYLAAEIKQTNYVYLISEDNQFSKRKGFKTLKQAVEFVHDNSDQKCAIEIITKKDAVVFGPDILLELYDCKDKVEIFSIKFKKLTLTKVFFFKFKDTVSRQDVQKGSIDLKAFQNDTDLTICMIVLNQTNIGNYQTKNTYQKL